MLHSLPQYAPQSLQIVLPFFPVGTMERVDREGEIATARTLARIVSSIPPSRGGPVDMVIFDIHALQARPRPACALRAAIPPVPLSPSLPLPLSPSLNPPPPSPYTRTDWTRLVPPPVLTGHVSPLLP